MTDISIVIVNRNTRDILLDCIGSVYATIAALTFDIWLVDNGSSDGSVQAVRDRFPEVRCIENGQNLGFSKANNIALRQVSGRYAVLLNTDALLEQGALKTIIDFMDNNSDVAVCGGQLLNGDGSLQNSIANVPTLATELLNKSLLRRLNPSRYPGKETSFDHPVAVESIIGACMVVRKEAMDSVGFLDEAYFFFFEETDWCLRMANNGWRVFFHPQARIYHLQGQTANKNVLAARVEYWRSRYIFFRKHNSSGERFVLRIGLVFRLIISVLLQLASSPFSRSSRYRLRVNAGLLFWHILGTPRGWGFVKGSDDN